MESEEKKKQEMEELVSLLGNIKGRHTELVTVMISSGYDKNAVTRQLDAEKSTAANIKSKQTRNAVIESLERIIRELKNLKQTPPNGLALFCGNVSEKEGVQDIQFWAIEPIKPLKVRLYRCDQIFVVDALKEMLEVDEVYGLLVIDRQEATIGLLEGKQIKVIRKLSSGVPGKIRAGGQCLSPDTFIVEKTKGKIELKDVEEGDLLEAINFDTLETLYNKCKKKWTIKKEKSLSIITNGEYPSSKIHSSYNHVFYIYNKNRKIIEKFASDLKEGDFLIGKGGKLIKILSINKIDNIGDLIDIEVKNKNFFANNILVHNSSQRFHRITEGLAKEFFRRVAEEMKDAFFEMPKLKGILVGGPIPTKEEFLEEGQLVTKLKEKVIAVKDLGYTDEHGLELLVEQSEDEIAKQELIKEKKILEKFFQTLGKNPEKASYGEEKTRLALERGAVDKLLLSIKLPKNKIQEFEKLAENIGAEVSIISTENQDGEQFLNLTKGFGAILRFALE